GGVRVSASAVDNEAVVGMALLVDGHLALEVGEASLHYTVDTNTLGPGWHMLVVEARDGAVVASCGQYGHCSRGGDR
ncbi:MAG: hypothetical protein V3T55_07485, partial [Anaerolineales bacterium]